MYLRNKNNPEQIVTIARKIVNGKMYVAACVNKVPYDEFDKHLARHIVSQRIADPKRRIELDSIPPVGQKEVSVLRALVEYEGLVFRKIRQVAKQYLETYQPNDVLEASFRLRYVQTSC
jgi:hypothetical protein